MGERLLNISEAAERLGRPVSTLYDWRYRKVGPPSARLLGKIVYRESELMGWIDDQFAKAAN